MNNEKSKPNTSTNSDGYDWLEESTVRSEPSIGRRQLPPEIPKTTAKNLGSTNDQAEINAGDRHQVTNEHNIYDSVQIPTLTDQVADLINPTKTLSEHLIEKKYHPVMIFGDSGSGKSSLLASLLHFMQHDQNAGAICMLGDWILPTDSDEGSRFADEASAFFNRDIMAFNDGQPAPATRVQVPFYIPVIVRPNNGKPDIRLAFLESRGEDYRINSATASFFPEIKREISDVYENFPGPISLVIISPYTYRDVYTSIDVAEGEEDRFKLGDKALYGALQAYQRSRRWPEMDNYMFVLTKWDMYTKGVSAPEFTNPPRGLAEKMIRERYPLAWNLFRNMPQSNNANAMQYSAGLIAGDGVITTPDKFKPAVYRYPRALWNWIYTNASGGKSLYNNKTVAKSSGIFSWLKKILS
jgi:energy-coupling factor transporter ATP-binding protein EcfA2